MCLEFDYPPPLKKPFRLLRQLNSRYPLLRSNHVSDLLNLPGSYPTDRQALIETARAALGEAGRFARFDEIPNCREEMHL